VAGRKLDLFVPVDADPVEIARAVFDGTGRACISICQRSCGSLEGAVLWSMADAEKKGTDLPVLPAAEEDEKTLAAIDRGIRDADAGRVTPIEEVEKMISTWISKSSSPTRR